MARAEATLAYAEGSQIRVERAAGVLEIAALRLQAELGADDPQALEAIVSLALAEYYLALADGSTPKIELAISALEKARQRAASVLGDTYPEVLTLAQDLPSARRQQEHQPTSARRQQEHQPTSARRQQRQYLASAPPVRDMDPSVYRRRLRNTLRRERESQGIIQATAATAMSWSVSKLIRIETGMVTISVNDLKALLGYYQVDDPERVASLVEMARSSRWTSWTSPYKGIASDVFLTFIGHEDAAVRSYSFQPVFVPGLLQTDEYATEVLRVVRGSKDPQRISGLVELRIARQERVTARAGQIQLNYLIDESVARRVVGGPEVMKRQLSYLIDECERDHPSIRIIPFRTGVNRSMRVPFVVLEFSDPEEEAVLYLEYPQRESLIREDGPYEDADPGVPSSPPTTPPTYLEIFAELQHQTSREETLRILRSALADLESGAPPDAPLPLEPSAD